LERVGCAADASELLLLDLLDQAASKAPGACDDNRDARLAHGVGSALFALTSTRDMDPGGGFR
jgi:hypothetical protein